MAEIRHLGSWRQNEKTRFSGKLNNLVSCNCAFQRTHYLIPTIQDSWDPPSWKWTWRHFFLPIFFSDFDKISETGAEWHVDCSDMVKIETRCRISIWRTFGRIQWHVISEPRITLQGAATWWIHCHDPRATCHIAGCSHLAKSMWWSCHIAGVRIPSAYW